MVRPRLRLAAVVGSLALVGALSVPTAAHAAPGDDILVFSNSNVVDTSPGVDGGEYEWISAAISAAGYDVTPFDGGDGEASTWTTALTDIEVFVLPEQEAGQMFDPDSPPAWMSTAAKDALVAWIQGGGAMLISGACDPGEESLLNEAVGVDYSNVMSCNSFDSAARWIDDGTLPAALPYVNGTYTMTLSEFSEAQLAPLTVWYSGEDEDECSGETQEELAVGVFAAGSGSVAIEAWDYFNDSGNPGQADWNSVLDSLLNGNAAASTWVPSVPPVPPVPKAPITTTTDAGEFLYSVSALETCGDEDKTLLRVDPASALATPIGTNFLEGDVAQGAWNPVTETAYFPFYEFDSGSEMLMTVDPETGVFTEVGDFTVTDLDYFDDVYSLAIGPDGAAYLMARLEIGDDYYELALFSLNLTDASLTFIAAVDDSLLDEPNGFAADPTTGDFYAFEEDSHEFFQVNVATGLLTSLGFLDAPSIDEDDSDITALQIGADGTFWVVFDDADIDDTPEDAGMLATFTLADIAGGVVSATEVGILTDDPFASRSLLLVAGPPTLPATGTEIGWPGGAAALLLVLGGLMVSARAFSRRTRSV